MNDGCIWVIKFKLIEEGIVYNVMFMLYVVKFFGCFYGFFCDVVGLVFLFGDCRCYQFFFGGCGFVCWVIICDISEGVDIIMVKLVFQYLDVISDVKEFGKDLFIVVYQVSGEFVMIYVVVKVGVFDFKVMVFESIEGIFRVGVIIIISYFILEFLDWLSN